jgi:CRISPR-associated protein Csm2
MPTRIEEAASLREALNALEEKINRANKEKRWEDKKKFTQERDQKLDALLTTFKPDEISQWISSSLNEDAITFTEFYGRHLKYSNLTTTQIRNVFGEVKRMEMSRQFSYNDFLLLKPRLAYASERKGTTGSKDFRKVIEKAIDAVIAGKDEAEKQKRFENFAAFFEAILAYHRSFGGK